MKEFKTKAFIYSLNKGKLNSTELDEVTVLEELGDNKFKVRYKDKLCIAIYNSFNCFYYVDDIYGVINE